LQVGVLDPRVDGRELQAEQGEQFAPPGGGACQDDAAGIALLGVGLGGLGGEGGHKESVTKARRAGRDADNARMNARLRRYAMLFALLLTTVLPTFALGQDAPPSAPAEAPEVDKRVERWYILLMQGQRAGWIKSVQTHAGGKITTESEVQLEIKREALKLRIGMTSEFVETDDGKPISQQSTQKLGAMSTTRRVRFMPDGTMEVTNLQPTPGGAPVKSVQTKPASEKPWLTPAAAERFVAGELAKGATTIVVTMLDPSLGEEPVTVTRTVLERTTAEAFGKVVPAVKWKNAIASMPGAEAVEFVDDDGQTIRSEINLGGISVVQVLADRELALSKLDAPEMLASLLVPVPEAIANARQSRVGTYIVTSQGSLTDLPSVGGQTFKRTGPQSGEVTVRAGEGGGEVVPEGRLAEVKAEHLKASAMLDTRDEEIIKLAGAIDLTGLDAPAAAERVRRFVHKYIKAKDMSVGFATASEVCRTRTGDCTEHAVLLAALLRAKGVPARVVSGLIYIDEFAGKKNVFGYHMWSQALVDGQWVNLDATLGEGTPYDAAHITLSVSSLNEGEVQNFLVATAPLIGKLKIEVVKVE